MYISLRWGGGGDMSPRSKVRTFDLPLSTVCTEFFYAYSYIGTKGRRSWDSQSALGGDVTL